MSTNIKAEIASIISRSLENHAAVLMGDRVQEQNELEQGYHAMLEKWEMTWAKDLTADQLHLVAAHLTLPDPCDVKQILDEVTRLMGSSTDPNLQCQLDGLQGILVELHIDELACRNPWM